MRNPETCDNHYVDLMMFPDYTSSGIWCTCGINIGNPKEELSIPHWIIDLVELWNDYWDMCSLNNKKLNVENVEKHIDETGIILSRLISQYVPCKYIPERSKLDCNVKE